jgi:hypothetical protein
MNKHATLPESNRPPVWFITGCSLGNDAFEGAMATVDALRSNFTAGEMVARGADFPSVVA